MPITCKINFLGIRWTQRLKYFTSLLRLLCARTRNPLKPRKNCKNIQDFPQGTSKPKKREIRIQRKLKKRNGQPEFWICFQLKIVSRIVESSDHVFSNPPRPLFPLRESRCCQYFHERNSDLIYGALQFVISLKWHR